MLYHTLLLCLPALASFAVANPVATLSSKTVTPTSTSAKTATSTVGYSSLPQVARFENEPGLVPVVDASPVGIYLDILWNGFSGNVAPLNGVGVSAGILPQSPNVDIAYAIPDLVTEEEGTPEMTTVYPDTTVVFFDLFSFFFGCVIGLEQADADPVVSCTVTATCVNPASTTVATQSFSFVSNGGLLQNMVEAKPSGFKGCQFVSFNTTSAGGATTATVMDTISYTVYSKLPFSPK